MKRYMIILAIVLIILTACKHEPLFGGDRDEHGCIGTAGYQWCPSTDKCQRMWEEYCDEFKEQFRVTDFKSCVAAKNPVMESFPRQCQAEGNTYTEELD